MYITLDILQKRGACQEYLDFFAKRFPDGVEMLHMIERGHMPYHALHWGYKWLDPNEEEIIAYWKAVHVTNSEGIDESDHVENSQIVAFSSRVTDSYNIYHSEQITNSRFVADSKFITDGEHINTSEFVDNSKQVLGSKNITDSREIVDSVYIVNSDSVTESNNVVDSYAVWKGENLSDCFFCFNCHNLSKSLFCTNLNDGEFYLFNKKIDENRFNMIAKQFRRYVAGGLTLAKNWDNQNRPRRVINYRKQFANISASFWEWVKTLPGYDAQVVYSLTFDPQVLN